jgi:hypothetical protein
VLLCFLVTLPGCGGCGVSAPRDDNAAWGGMGSKEAYMEWKAEQEKLDKAAEAEEEKRLAGPPKPAQKLVATKPDVPQEREAAALTKVDNTLRLPPIPRPPRDLARWKQRDFLVARIRQRPELLDAIALAATRQEGNEEVVETFTTLLQPEQYAALRELVLDSGDEPTAQAAGPRTAGRVHQGMFSRDVINATVDALAKMGTPAARRALAQLIVGKLVTEDNSVAAKTAIEILAAYPSPAHEEMLIRVAVEAERIVSAEQPGLSPVDLRRQALSLLNQASSPGLRLRMAESLVRSDLPQEVRRAFAGNLAKMEPENFDAHLLLYLNPSAPSTPSRTALAKHFAAYSSQALSHFLGLELSDTTDDLHWNRHVAGALWAENVALVVEGQLDRLDSWSEEPAILALALSLPTDTMRAASAEQLSRQWPHGPGPQTSNTTGAEAMIEPGVLVLLRALLEARGTTQRLPSLASLRNQRAGRGRSAARADPVSLQRQQEWQLQDAWARLAGAVAADWCTRCRTAAHHRDAAERARGRRIDWTRDLADMPIQPHALDEISETHRAVWGGAAGLGPAGQSLDPLALHYVRIEERTRPTRLLAVYERLLPPHQKRELVDGIAFEGVMEGESGILRSFDVRITRSAFAVRRLPEEEQDLVVEMLIVQIRDPGLTEL